MRVDVYDDSASFARVRNSGIFVETRQELPIDLSVERPPREAGRKQIVGFAAEIAVEFACRAEELIAQLFKGESPLIHSPQQTIFRIKLLSFHDFCAIGRPVRAPLIRFAQQDPPMELFQAPVAAEISIGR